MLLVGEAPSRSGDAAQPLAGRIGKRLAALSGLTLEQFLERTQRVNLLQVWPGSAGRGSAFPRAAAATAATALLPQVAKGSSMLLCGRRVAGAFGMGSAPYLTWCELDGARVAVLPHPSGINRWYNDAENVRALSAFLSAQLRNYDDDHLDKGTDRSQGGIRSARRRAVVSE